jgi:hypothetical protein
LHDGDQIAETFRRACGLPARFRQTPIEQIRAFDMQLAQMFTFFNEHPSELADLSALRAEHPGLMRDWRPGCARPDGSPERRKRALPVRGAAAIGVNCPGQRPADHKNPSTEASRIRKSRDRHEWR